MSAFPFDDWMRLSVTVFKLSPRDFWAMSVQDWLTLTAPQTPEISAVDLRSLMKKFPDEETQNG